MPGVLTKKQSWRRQSICSRRRQHDLIYQEGFAKDVRYGGGTRSFSDQSFSEGPPLVHNGFKPWATTGNLQEHKHDLFGNKLKSVMFSARVHLILIPSISEYEAAGLAGQLWWSDVDYKDFKQKALQEVKDYMTLKSISDSKLAIKILYQQMDSDDLQMITDQQTQSASVSSNPTSSDAIMEPPCVTMPIRYLPYFRRLDPSARAHSFCVNTPHPSQVPEITSFRSKTDVDIIHDKSTEAASQEFLNRLRKLHVEWLSKNKSLTAEPQNQLHPLALICD